MRKFRIIFTQSQFDGKFLDNGISGWTWLINLGFKRKHKIPWSVYNALRSAHVEVWTPGYLGNFEDGLYYNRTFAYLGKCWTSTLQGENDGVCVRPASEVLSNPKGIFYTEFSVNDLDYEDMIADMEKDVENNQGYEKKLIKRYFGLEVEDSPDHYICSEFVSEKLMRAGIFIGSVNPSPFRIALELWLKGQAFYDLATGRKLT